MNLFKTTILLSFLSALLVLVGYLLVGGTIGAIVGLGIAALVNFGAWFYSDRVALAYYNAKPPNPSQTQLLEPIVKVLCHRAKLPVPKIYIVPTPAANAFATGRNPHHGTVAVTEGLMQLLNSDFLRRLFSTHPPVVERVQQLQNLKLGKSMSKPQRRNRVFASIVIILAASGLTYAPIPGMETTITIVSGTELTEPLQQLESKFEQANPNIKLALKFQGSQEMVNKYLNDQNDFQPTVLIPANENILTELSDRFRATNNTEPFSASPQPIAKTMLVGIAWTERGKVLFPDGRWSWQRLEEAMQAGNWSKIGGSDDWGSFDFVTTDPTRSNSGQITLGLWALSRSGNLNDANFNNPAIETLFSLIKRSVYQPPRSTDILLQEFIAKGPNEADVATVYESIALHRSPQSGTKGGTPYQIYYLDPTFETTATAAILSQNVTSREEKAAQKFLDFLTQPEQQAVFVQYGFRPANNSVDLKSVPNNPWNQNIPGAQIQPTVQTLPLPNARAIAEIQRLWERAN